MSSRYCRWMAPDTLTNNKHGPSGDVWSLGVVYWELLTLVRVRTATLIFREFSHF